MSYFSVAFKLHYKATVAVLLIAALLVTSRQFFGEPIECLVEAVPSAFINTYCWVHATYTTTPSSNLFRKRPESKLILENIDDIVFFCHYGFVF